MPAFNSKSSDVQSVFVADVESSIDTKIGPYGDYKEKANFNKSDQYRKIKEKQEKAEVALKQWRRLKFEKFKRNFSKNDRSSENL